MLDRQLPSTGHPLGVLAQAWLLINCIVGGGFLGRFLGLTVPDLAWRLLYGRHAPRHICDTASDVGILAGAGFGLFAFIWIVDRLNRRGLDFVLLSMSFIPFVGPPIAVICGLWLVFEHWRNWIRKKANNMEAQP